MMGTMEQETGAIPVAAGPLEAEREVLRWVQANRARDAGELWPPLRIVVPSRSLRRHLLAVLTRELGALAGVVVQTHRALAREVLEAAGETPPPGGATLQEVMVRRLASEHEALREALGELEDGYGVVAASVRDLLDAGLGPATIEAAAEAIAGAVTGGRAERCLAVLETARRWLELVEETGLPARSALLVRATGLLAAGDRELLPARAVLIHGFAEATGLLSDLLEALVRHHGATAILDLPPDPSRPGERDAGWRFAERLGDRLAGAGATARLAAAPPSVTLPAPDLFVAPGRDAEVREVATRIRALLDGGAVPETIGVVARRLDEPLLAAIRRQFGRLGIPFSGEGASVAAAEGRRARALAELLVDGPATPVAAWLEAADPGGVPGGPRLAGLALRTAGAHTVADAASLEIDLLCPGGRPLDLPVVEGIEERNGVLRRKRRQAEAVLLGRIRSAAEHLCGILAARPARGTAEDYRRWVRDAATSLGLPADPPEEMLAPVGEFLDTLRPAGELPWETLAPVLAEQLVRGATVPAGGAGGGVAVLAVTEARGRTFEHLFVMGLERGVFPFRRPEDPLLPEAAREALAAVLPEIPLARRSPLEERYLFAQLLASARHLTLSWARFDQDGREINPSAFLERLALEGRLPGPLRGDDRPFVPDVFDPGRSERPRPELEHLVPAGLDGDRAGVAAMLEALDGPSGVHAARVLDVLDPPQRPAPVLGPMDGLVGAPPVDEFWVTRLEALSRCPFQAFLERELGLEPPPEAAGGTDRLGGRVLGSVVHEALEEVAKSAGVPAGRWLDAIEGSETVSVAWPDPDELERIIARVARRVAAREGCPALTRALARRAATFLERAREVDWQDGCPPVLGVEVRSSAEVPAARGAVTVKFRADRVDRTPDGLFELTDYKTGSVDNAVKHSTRVGYVRRGKLLQGGVYALCRPAAKGRYLVLKEEVEPNGRVVALDGSGAQEAIRTAVALAVDEILSCLESGVLFPRVGAKACDTCSVRPACLCDDSSYRLRIEAALAELDADHPVRRLWDQPRAKMPEEAG